MPLSVALLFHFNQHFSEFAGVASRACYRGLLKTLRTHPNLKFNIHISGTLTDALKWLDPEPLALIQAGVDAGQFELLGSTYAQNILYSTDDWDNEHQIALHRSTLKQTFGVEPTVFWNVERCWRQSLVPLIAKGGYTTTLVEEHTLKAAGATGPYTFTTQAEGSTLKVITDEDSIKAKFNFAAWFGRNRQILEHLRERAARPEADKLCITYAEDAEAMGLWDWEKGLVPNQTWANLDKLLTALEQEPDVQLIKLSDAPAPQTDLTPIPDGAAAWMNVSLSKAGLPYHEDGYTDWFDFNRRSPKVVHFRQTYSIVRFKMGMEPPPSAPAQRLWRAALHAYLAHQYEFGCIGVGGLNYRGWEDARAAVALSLAAQEAEHPREFILIDDCNGDGSDEVLIGDGKQLIVTSAYGGRLLYWFDLTTGQQLIGNQLPVMSEEYHGSEYSYPAPRPAHWLPESDAPLDVANTQEEPPTRLGRFLPEWIWEGEPAPFKLAVAPEAPAGTRQPISAQTRALCDLVTLKGATVEEIPLEWLDSRLEKNGVTFIRYLSDQLTLEKSYRLAYGRMVIVSYTLRNLDEREQSFRLRITNELCPDYESVIAVGRKALTFIEGEAPGVLNIQTQTSVTIQANRAPDAVEQREDFCALNVGLVYNVTLGPRSEQKIEVKLAKSK
jgi:Glycosyl hydrolase family 57